MSEQAPQPAAEPKSLQSQMSRFIRDSLISGIVVAIPLYIVYWVVERIILQVEGVLGPLPTALVPQWVKDIPGLGFVVTLLVLLALGTLFRGFVGRRLVSFLEGLLRRVPLIGTLYFAFQQLLKSVFSADAQSFQRVVLVEFPRRHSYCLGFVTERAWSGVETAVGRTLISVFVPTTPNPTSGFFMMIPEDELIVLNMTVEEAFKAIMSSGIVMPEDGGVLHGVDPKTVTQDIEPVTLTYPSDQ
ncbi:MAG: DUF502 domain-containing protein [Deltaproteobacteria bacterium]|nr:DUF502 domain-containing protein [Deltaproteobacteria bacterium]